MKDKICIITGATGGIGYYLSLGFLEKFYKVIAIDIEEIKALPKEIDFIKADLSKEADIKNAFDYIKKKYKYANVLINNAGISEYHKSIDDIETLDFNKIINVNLIASFICSKEFVDLNKNEKYGRIINIASTRHNQNEAGWEAYGASKGGLVSLTNTMAISLSDTQVTVNAISPGWIQTNNYDKLSKSDHRQHPSGRVGNPDDILNAAIFLADEKSDFINAHNLIVDGGMTKKMIYE